MTDEFSQFGENSVQFLNSLSSFGAGSPRVQVNLVVDPVLHGWIKNLTVLITESNFMEGSRTKIDKSLDPTALKIFFVFTSLYFSILIAEEFRSIIENRWDELWSKPSNLEQAWLIPQPSAGTLGETQEI